MTFGAAWLACWSRLLSFRSVNRIANASVISAPFCCSVIAVTAPLPSAAAIVRLRPDGVSLHVGQVLQMHLTALGACGGTGHRFSELAGGYLRPGRAPGSSPLRASPSCMRVDTATPVPTCALVQWHCGALPRQAFSCPAARSWSCSRRSWQHSQRSHFTWIHQLSRSISSW